MQTDEFNPQFPPLSRFSGEGDEDECIRRPHFASTPPSISGSSLRERASIRLKGLMGSLRRRDNNRSTLARAHLSIDIKALDLPIPSSNLSKTPHCGGPEKIQFGTQDTGGVLATSPAQNGVEKPHRGRKLLKIFSTKLRSSSPKCGSPSHPPSSPLESSEEGIDEATRERRLRALMASGLLRAQPLSVQEHARDSQLPVPSSAKSGLSPPEGPSPAMLIRQEWSKKEEAKEKDRLKSFRFGNSSASNTPTSPSFEKDVLSALETLGNSSTSPLPESLEPGEHTPLPPPSTSSTSSASSGHSLSLDNSSLSTPLFTSLSTPRPPAPIELILPEPKSDSEEEAESEHGVAQFASSLSFPPIPSTPQINPTLIESSSSTSPPPGTIPLPPSPSITERVDTETADKPLVIAVVPPKTPSRRNSDAEIPPLSLVVGALKTPESECFSPLSDMPSLVGSSALTDEEQECNSDAGASHLADDTALSDSPIIVQEPFESTEDTTIIPGSSKPPVLDPPPTCSLAASVSKSSEENNRRTKFLGAFRRSQTLDTSTSLSPPASPTPPTTKKAGRSSIFRRSKTLSGKSPKVDPLSLPPSPFLKSSFDKTGLPTTPTSPTHFESRLAVSPTIHNRQSMIAELEDIEDDEARRTAEMMFLD